MSDGKVKSAMRAFEILEHFRLTQQARSMSELSADLGYPASSTTVLLKTLVKMGYLNYDRVRRVYFPTTKVAALGDWVHRALFGNGRIIDAINDVHAITGEGTFIGTKNDIYLQYLKTKQSLHALRFHIEEGTVRVITRSAAGWILLSTLSDSKIDDMIRRANIATSSPVERVKVNDIFDQIEKIRQQGYARAESIPFEGGATLAVLLPIQIQDQPVTLAIGGAVGRFREHHDKYLSALRSAAQQFSNDHDFELPVQIEL